MSNEPTETTKDIAGPEVRMALGTMIVLIALVAIVTVVS